MKIKSFAVIVATCTILCHWDAFGCSEGSFMKQIHLGGKHGSIIGNYALVDDNDYEYLNQWKWFTYGTQTTRYACRNTGRDRDTGFQGKVIMHRLILGVSETKVLCDHIDGDGLNNQRHNLRVATYSQNGMNRRCNTGAVSPFKGVVLHGQGKWQSQICIGGKNVYLGLYESEKDAAMAYNEAATKHYGEFAKLNIIKL